MSLRAKTKYVPPNKPAANSGITLFYSAGAVACLWVRLVLAEKDVDGARLQIERPDVRAKTSPCSIRPMLCPHSPIATR